MLLIPGACGVKCRYLGGFLHQPRQSEQHRIKASSCKAQSWPAYPCGTGNKELWEKGGCRRLLYGLPGYWTPGAGLSGCAVRPGGALQRPQRAAGGRAGAGARASSRHSRAAGAFSRFPSSVLPSLRPGVLPGAPAASPACALGLRTKSRLQTPRPELRGTRAGESAGRLSHSRTGLDSASGPAQDVQDLG